MIDMYDVFFLSPDDSLETIKQTTLGEETIQQLEWTASFLDFYCSEILARSITAKESRQRQEQEHMSMRAAMAFRLLRTIIADIKESHSEDASIKCKHRNKQVGANE